MADPDTKIKDETKDEVMSDISDISDLTDLDPVEGEENGLFVEDTVPIPAIIESILHLSTNMEELPWHQCGTDPKSTLAQKVAIKEAAIQVAISRLQKLVPALEAVQKKLPTRPHVDTITRLITKYKATVLLIGLMGVTGAGKSSMINALLGMKDLLPADDGAAVTASVIKILWNENEDPKRSIRAEIEFVTVEELNTELEAFNADLSEEHNDTINGAERDDEREERIKRNLQWIQNIWPFVRNRDDFRAQTIPGLIAHQNIQNCIGQVKNFEASSVGEFSSWIRPYVAVTDKSAGALWPIVKVVRIYTRSPVLKEGICLVDLPGVCDTNTARGAIANKVQGELGITLVVADALRAESNKSAQDLLGSVRQRTMKLDNQFSTDRLAFVISKCDNQIMVDRYIKLHLASNPQVVAILKKKEKAEALKKTGDSFLTKKKEEATRLKTRLGRLQKQLKQLEKNSGAPQKRKLEDEDQETPQSPEILKLKQDLKDTRNSHLEVRDEVLAAQDKVDELTKFINQCRSRLTNACIVHRHKQSSQAITQDYVKDAHLAQIKSSKPLKVFSISANAYFERLEGDDPIGFPTTGDTGIPRLQNWFINSTLRDRKEHSDRCLQEIVALEKSLDISLTSSAMGYKMSEEKSKTILNIFEDKLAVLRSQMLTANNEAGTKVEKLVQNGLFLKLPAIERIAIEAVVDVVTNNGLDIHWAVFRSTNKKMGHYTHVKGEKTITYDFNANMAGAYFDPLMKDWCATIHEKIPASRTLYETKIQTLMETFVRDITAMVEDNCPAITLQINAWGESALASIEIIRNNALEVFNATIKNWVKNTHLLMAKEIQKIWAETYEACGEAKGKGHFVTSKGKHINHITEKDTAKTMFKKGSKAMRKHLRTLFKKLADELEKGTKVALRQVEREFFELLENHTLSGDENSNKSKFQSEKDSLRKLTKGVFKAIAEDWKKEMTFEPVEKEVLEELVMPTLEGLYGDKEVDMED